MFNEFSTDIISKYNIDKIIGYPIKVIVSNFLSGVGPGLFASLIGDNKIAINKGWVELLTNKNNALYNEYIEDAFLVSIIHEMTHKRYNKIRKNLKDKYKVSALEYYIPKNNQFIKWVDEINADFGIYYYIHNNTQANNILCNSCMLKMLNKKKIKSYHSHPSWVLRYYLALNFQNGFDEDVINHIAKICDFTNIKLIDAVKGIYLS